MRWIKAEGMDDILHEGKTYLLVRRVPYGKSSTPKGLREYIIYPGSPVGTRKEMEYFFEDRSLGERYSGIAFQDGFDIEYVDIATRSNDA